MSTGDLHPACAPLGFLLGRWRGEGVGGYPSLDHGFRFVQEVVFWHVGKPYLAYSSRSWLLDDDGVPGAPAAGEMGYWRPAGGADEESGTRVELLLAHPTGFVEIWYGQVTGTRVELATDAVARTATAKQVSAGHRLYGLVEGDLAYAFDMAAQGHELQPHTSARLSPVSPTKPHDHESSGRHNDPEDS